MKVQFYPSSREVELVVPPPKPAAYYIPKWYKQIPKFSEKDVNAEMLAKQGPGIKSCIPFFDSMSSGYIQETWQDIVVDFRDGKLNVTSPTTPEIVHTREISSVPMGNGFYGIEFIWHVPWITRLPKGWSMLYSSPFNHAELPFQSLTGIMDNDVFYHSPFGNYPFYIKYGFKGVIPAGTPMFQMVPIKRESWKSGTEKWDSNAQFKRDYLLRRKSFGAYKKFFHIKKDYS